MNSTNHDAAYERFTKDILPRFLIIIDKLTVLSNRYNELALDKTIESSDLMQKNSIMQLAIIIFILVVSVVIGLLISKLAINPVTKITKAAEMLAKGELDTKISIKSKNEIGRMAEAINNAIGLFKSICKDIDEVMREISNGNLTVNTTINYVGDFKSIQSSVTQLIEKIGELMSSVISTAEQVASGANLVSNSSNLLSQGATEQASSVEELTASLEEIAAQTSINAQNAQTANESAKQVKINAEEGNEQMKNMLKAMEDINQASNSISKIIKVIDDIAFQTNILALNAAVEAARAGQHGMGFAVVAEEVRTLASKSAQAANETTELIEGSIRKVEAGTKIANETAGALSKIVVDVAKAADLIDSIARASNEQAAAIEQINQGVMQISTVVQSNAATSEESSAASVELSSQADQLKELVGSFKVKTIVRKQELKNYQQAPVETKSIKAVASVKRTINLSGEFGKY